MRLSVICCKVLFNRRIFVLFYCVDQTNIITKCTTFNIYWIMYNFVNLKRLLQLVNTILHHIRKDFQWSDTFLYVILDILHTPFTQSTCRTFLEQPLYKNFYFWILFVMISCVSNSYVFMVLFISENKTLSGL